MRRSPEYQAAREAALHDLDFNDVKIEVILPIEDVLGRNYATKVEGVRRLGSVKNPTGTEVVDFDGGSVVAVFKLSLSGEPQLLTMYPIGG
ncbi:MAG: hypothetical protein JKY94_05580 [Rhodobacteraceae bacterium]|nr:hypothetical protein [Paracoccaceae bacterium]